jgi:hypothetical protein
LRLRFARLSLLVKILLSTSCAVTLLFGIIMLIIVGNINRGMSDSLREKEAVRSSFRAYESLWKLRVEMRPSVSRIVCELKEVRSAIGIGGKATVEDGAGELWSKISWPSASFLVTDPDGKVLASWGGASSPLPAGKMEIVRSAVASKYPGD